MFTESRLCVWVVMVVVRGGGDMTLAIDTVPVNMALEETKPPMASRIPGWAMSMCSGGGVPGHRGVQCACERDSTVACACACAWPCKHQLQGHTCLRPVLSPYCFNRLDLLLLSCLLHFLCVCHMIHTCALELHLPMYT